VKYDDSDNNRPGWKFAEYELKGVPVRIAIGATPRAIVTLILSHAARLVVAGVVIGLGAAALATKVLQSMLFATSTTDALTFIVVPVALAVVATIACLVPAFRATRTDPLIVIRAE